jgi:protein-tyrosine phosphatase
MAPAPAPPLPPARQPGTPYRICLVCLGNYCRSPMAEAVLRARVAQAGLGGAVVVDSAGTGDWHAGQPMHRMALETLRRRGYDGSAHRGRQLTASWLKDRDLFLAMDAGNLATLVRMAGPGDRDRIRLFGEVGGLSGTGGGEIPDPYGGSSEEFGQVLDLLTAAAPVIVDRLSQLLEPGPGAAG